MRRSQRGFEPSLVPIQSFGAKAMSAKRRNKYEDAADCPGFEFDPVYGFQSLCALCRFPKRLHPSDPSFMFEVTKSPERRRSQAPRWVPYGNGYRRSDRSAPPGARRRNSTSRISGGSSGAARLSRRLSEALSSSGGRRRASSAGEVAKPAMDEGTDSDEDEDTSTGEDDNVERNATRASLRRSRNRLDDKDADANTSEEDENDVRRSRRSSSKKSQRMSFARRMSSASRRSTASRRSSKARDDDDVDDDDDKRVSRRSSKARDDDDDDDDDDDKRVSRRSSKARDDDEDDQRLSRRSISSRRSSKARDDDDDDKRVSHRSISSRRSSKARDDDEDDKRVSHRSVSSRRSSKARDDDDDDKRVSRRSSKARDDGEDDQRLSRRSSRRSSGRRSYAREPTIGSFAASSAAAGNARKDSEDEDTGGSENDDDDDDNAVAGKRTSTRSSGSKRGSVASRVSQRVSAALQRSAKRLSTISEGSERSEASQKQREQQGDDEDENTTDDDAAAAADRTSVHKSASRRSSNVIVGIASAITTGAAAVATRMSKASGRSAVSARSSAKSAAAAADDDDEENMSQVSYEEEDYDAFVGKECRAMYHDSETFHPAEVLSHDGDGCFTVRFQKSGTIQRDTEAHDIQIVDDEHDLVAPAEGRVDYDDQIDSLFEACECKDAIALQVLLQKGLNPDERNGMGETPLVVAARAGDVTCAKMLLQFGAADSDGAALAASSSDEMRKLVTEFGFGKTSRDAKLVRYSSGRLDVARKHLSESAVTARRDRRPSRYAGSGSGGAAGPGAAGRGTSWPLTARDAAEDEMRSQHSERSRLPSFRGIRRSSSGLAKALCFAQGGKHHGEYEH